eukprot:24063-Eustigmatos_ZCMA.PRE.1
MPTHESDGFANGVGNEELYVRFTCCSARRISPNRKRRHVLFYTGVPPRTSSHVIAGHGAKRALGHHAQSHQHISLALA